MNLTGHNPKLKPVDNTGNIDEEARDRSVKLRQEQNKKEGKIVDGAIY